MAETVSPLGFGALYERHSRAVYRFALALTANVAQAEDLTAEAFLRVWQAGERVDQLTVRGYLIATVRNLNRSQWRREKRLVQMPEGMQAPAVDPNVHLELERVIQALDHLDPADREVLLMRAEGGLSYEEIAELTGLTEVAARSRAHRARKRLMEALCQKK
jgi:RNA polymerase sigma-70 factor (ECF subfamily)